MIVADTNLVAYLFIDGDRTATARAVMVRDPEWAAPALWRSEFRNIVATYMCRDEFGIEHGLDLLEKAEGLLAGREHVVPSRRILQLAADSGCTAYDCEFVAVAESLGAPLVTSDRQILRSFPDVAVTPEEFAREGA